MKRRSERVRFEGAFGDQLAARVDLPPEGPRAIALFAHCFTCSKDLKPIVRISRELAERGIGVVRFDFTGIGESAGDFADTNFTSNLEDLVAAAGFVRREYDGPQLLIGHSLGGAAVLAAAHRVPEARLVATIAAPSDTGQLSETLLQQAPELEKEGVNLPRWGLATSRHLIARVDTRGPCRLATEGYAEVDNAALFRPIEGRFAGPSLWNPLAHNGTCIVDAQRPCYN